MPTNPAADTHVSGFGRVEVAVRPPTNAPPWAMITPLPPPSGTTTWAVMEWDLFFRLMTEFPTEPGHAASPTPRHPR